MEQMAIFAALLVSLITCPSVMPQREPTSSLGTTEHIQQVFIGRCWDYEVTKYNLVLPRPQGECEDLWVEFYKAYAYREPCDVHQSYYESFYTLAEQELPKDKVMFWSGVYTIAHRYSEAGRNYVTLEDTLIGYLVNSLVWCGQSKEPGINYSACPKWEDCPYEASESFWGGASAKFAANARGSVTLMVDGSNEEKAAYRRSSFFGKYELPNMSQEVTQVKVLVIHNLENQPVETCGNGSLADLRDDVTARGFEFLCEDDPLSVKHLLCADDPTSRECRLVESHMAGEVTTTEPTQQQADIKQLHDSVIG